MSSCTIRIERAANGFEVEMTDPKIAAENKKTGPDKPWKDPCVSYVFKTSAEVVSFLQKNLEKAIPMDEYSSSFDAALEEEDDD